MNIVDRRPNPKGKSLSNRQRFIARAKAELKAAVHDSLRRRKVADVENGEKVAIPTRGIGEPTFRHNRRTGSSDYVVPGNKQYVSGDEIPRPEGGAGGGGSEASADGEGEDSFEFTLSKEEFLDMFFEDLELPDLVKKTLKESTAMELSRAGYSPVGTPANLSIRRTMRNSMARRISLKRPKSSEVAALEEELRQIEMGERDSEDAVRVRQELELLLKRTKLIPYIDPIDVRYNRFERIPKPNTRAVMFCLMDVSGSMTESMKDLAKRFFMLLHVFLQRRYETVDVVFIRHTSVAEEVDEETFFYSRETGGTVVSSALEKMLKIARDRYPLDTWNIYAAQASDGDNYGADSGRCVDLLGNEILPLCQYFAYIEVGDSSGGLMRDSDLWRSYSEVAPGHKHFAMKRVADPTQIFPVFHELFAKERARN
jgi:uncharacterized sporulation protein YeaH/YhbH (DUF444 family)